jgi:Tfp pilus assembly protein PilF
VLGGTPPTTSLTAYDLYLLGRSKANTRWVWNLQKAVEHLEQALEQDPKFAKAQAALALTRVLLIDMDDVSTDPRELRIEQAETAVYKALALDAKSAEAQVAYANFLRTTEREGAEAAYQRAIQLNPSSAEAWHGYGLYLSTRNDRRRADDAVRRAHELDPLAISPWMNYLGLLLRAGNKEAFKLELGRALTAFAGNPDAVRRFAILAGPAGFPLEAWRFVVAAQRDSAGSGLPRSMTNVGPLGIWMTVDPQYVIDKGQGRLPQVDDPEMRLWLLAKLISAHGRLGREAALEGLYAQYAQVAGDDDEMLNDMRAFWSSVFGRYDAAAAALKRGDPLRQEAYYGPSTLGMSEGQQSLPAMLRTYRATGRSREADTLAADALGRYRAERPAKPEAAPYDFWVRDAALAANEGMKAEAVEFLRQALRTAELPPDFEPAMPWFRSLEGYAPYDELLREFRARQAHAREGMLALDATLPPSLRL